MGDQWWLVETSKTVMSIVRRVYAGSAIVCASG